MITIHKPTSDLFMKTFQKYLQEGFDYVPHTAAFGRFKSVRVVEASINVEPTDKKYVVLSSSLADDFASQISHWVHRGLEVDLSTVSFGVGSYSVKMIQPVVVASEGAAAENFGVAEGVTSPEVAEPDKELEKILTDLQQASEEVVQDLEELKEEIEESTEEPEVDVTGLPDWSLVKSFETAENSKVLLEEYARKFGVELSRRKSFKNMVKAFEEKLV